MLPQDLDPVQVRVLGSLIEKEMATPDHYPLSLNALTSACNQSSNREPVMALDENSVSTAVTALRRLNLVRSFQASGSRVPRYQHLLAEAGELSQADQAVLCVLMLRGPQTVAEVRARAARLLPGDDSDAAEAALSALLARDGSPITRLQRGPGQKEARYAQLLSGAVAFDTEDALVPAPGAARDRIAALEETTAELRKEVDDLRAQLAAFRKQFE